MLVSSLMKYVGNQQLSMSEKNGNLLTFVCRIKLNDKISCNKY